MCNMSAGVCESAYPFSLGFSELLQKVSKATAECFWVKVGLQERDGCVSSLRGQGTRYGCVIRTGLTGFIHNI